MKTLQEALDAGEVWKEFERRFEKASPGHTGNITRNLSGFFKPDLLEIVNLQDPTLPRRSAQLFLTYCALLDEFPDYLHGETAVSKETVPKGHFPDILKVGAEQKVKNLIELYVLESQKQLRGITYRDE